MNTLILSIKITTLTFLALGCLASDTKAQSAGSLSGQVLTEDGKPVEGALISAHPKVAKASSAGVGTPSSAKSGADGSFALSGLTPGQYQVCVHDRKAGLLDPCQWSSAPPIATITVTAGASVPTITVKKGRLLEVHIVDSAGVMAAETTKPKLLVGLWQDNGLFITIPVRTADKKGRVHAQYVPRDKPLQISVASSDYTINDSTGAAIDSKTGQASKLDIPPGNQPITLTFQVTGHAE